jgi:3-hydroxy-3-methylglutaryl CoA synthase
MPAHPVGIECVGSYVPRVRLERAAIAQAHGWFNPGLSALAKGTRAIANWDEDAITQAVEAARQCLAGTAAPSIRSLVLASTSLPFADRQNAGVVKAALDLPDEVLTLDVTGSQRAGTSALLTAMSSARGGMAPVLCIGAEKCRPQPGSEHEMSAGDGAAAFLVGTENPAARLVGSRSVAIDFVDHFRAQRAEFDYGWESRWIRDEGFGRIAVTAIRAAFESSGVDPRALAKFVMPSAIAGATQRVARELGIRAEAIAPDTLTRVGHASSAQPLLSLALALERARAGDLIAAVGFGQGCDVLIFEATGRPARRGGVGLESQIAAGKSSSNYMRYLVINGLLPVDRGMRAETDMKTALTALYRDRRAVLGLVGGRDRKTGIPQFPRSEVPLGSTSAAAAPQDDYRFAEIPARIATYTQDALAYSIDPPALYGLVDFEGGGRMSVDFTDMDPEDAEVGRPVRMTFRIKAHDDRRDFTRYFWKATTALVGRPAGRAAEAIA